MKASMKKTFKIALIVLSVAVLVFGVPSLNVYAYSSKTDNSNDFYYRTMSLAFQDINSGSMGTRALPEKGIAYANIKVVKNANSYDIYLLKNYTENNVISIQTSTPVNVYFNVYTLRTSSVAFDIYYGKVTLHANGRGGISVNGTDKARCAQLRSGSLTIKNGYYEARSSNGTAVCIQSADKLVVQNAKLVAMCPTGQARCVSTVSGNANVASMLYNCNLTAAAKKGRSLCFYNAVGNEAELRNCVVNAYSNYRNVGNTAYAYSSVGVDNYGSMTLNNCTVFGTHSGVQSSGNLSVNKGNYSGYGHGGFYITGIGNYARIYNANIFCKSMPSGYTATLACNQAAIYIGGVGATNTRVYMNNCRLESASQPIVLRGTSGETNNYLYTSNSVMTRAKCIRIDSNHKVFIGVGNNFSASATTASKQVYSTHHTY